MSGLSNQMLAAVGPSYFDVYYDVPSGSCSSASYYYQRCTLHRSYCTADTIVYTSYFGIDIVAAVEFA